MMKLSKTLLLTIITLSLTVNIHAGRIKKDLVSAKEDEVATLIREKIAILDTLLAEAKIYKNESDPLMKKSFFNTPNLFLTKAKKRSEYVHTGIGSSVVYEKSSLGSSTLSKREMGTASADDFHDIRGHTMQHPFTYKFKKSKREAMQSQKYRNIFNLKMRRAIEATTSFSTDIHFVHLLSESMKDNLKRVKNKSHKKEINDLIGKAYLEKLDTPTKELFKKSHELISILSTNDISKTFSDKIRHNSVKRWAVHSRMFLFTLTLKKDKLYKKKLYQ